LVIRLLLLDLQLLEINWRSTWLGESQDACQLLQTTALWLLGGYEGPYAVSADDNALSFKTEQCFAYRVPRDSQLGGQVRLRPQLVARIKVSTVNKTPEMVAQLKIKRLGVCSQWISCH
jgi:hypothetical protein